ncbi:Uncharacterised protein [Plesiomonas shigelloides]|nr:Uncharacterised protein [Plesiomonas shigelloides]
MYWCCEHALFCKHRFHDNKELKQGHFEMGIHYVNFMPISNHCARKRAPLCPLAKCYQEENLTGSCLECYNGNVAVAGGGYGKLKAFYDSVLPPRGCSSPRRKAFRTWSLHSL